MLVGVFSIAVWSPCYCTLLDGKYNNNTRYPPVRAWVQYGDWCKRVTGTLPFSISYDNATGSWEDPPLSRFGNRDFITTTAVTNRKQQQSGRG